MIKKSTQIFLKPFSYGFNSNLYPLKFFRAKLPYVSAFFLAVTLMFTSLEGQAQYNLSVSFSDGFVVNG
jgi:hypothetical protein